MKSKKNLVIIALVILISLFGITYAFFEYYKLGDNQKITAGKVKLVLNEGTDTISLVNVFPETKEEARSRTDNQITFTVSGLNTTTEQNIYYEIMLNEGDEESDIIRFLPEHLVFDLIEVDSDGTETMVVDAMSYEDFNERTIWVNTIDHDNAENITRTYKLRMWLTTDIVISDTDTSADYTTTDFSSRYASVKVSVYGDFEEKAVSASLMNLVENNLSLTEADASGTRFVTGNVDTTATQTNSDEYSLSANNLVNFNNNSGVTEISNSLGVANYIWYSGKLWQIVAINSDNTIKIVTENSISNISWETTCSSNNYSTSQVRTWLNNEFLNTLENHDNLLVNANWDYTVDDTTDTVKPTTTSYVTDKVGLLTNYEYAMTGGANSYLNIKYIWWTMTPSSSENSNVWQVGGDGVQYGNVTCDPRGIRPSVTLTSNILIIDGDGTKNNPYIINGDKKVAKSNDKLNSRISGEYIEFNNTLYRIVGIENDLTKIIMADYDVNKNSISTSEVFGDDLTFSTTVGIGKYLDDWYNGTNISDTYKNMIATSSDGIVWYTGQDTGINRDYTLNKSGTAISATIGLPYYGEMFTSQFGTAHYESLSFWTMSKFSDSNVWVISDYDTGSGQAATSTFAVRPVMYLKSSVVVKDIDGDGAFGNGTLNSPYEIIML